jgi:hypothetical protein
MKMKGVIGSLATLCLILVFFLLMHEKIPNYAKSYIESYDWHAKKIITTREKLANPVFSDFSKNIMNLTGIDVNKEQNMYQERYRLKEKCNNENMDVVIFTNENEEVMGGYLIKTETDPGMTKLQSYNTFITISCKKQ